MTLHLLLNATNDININCMLMEPQPPKSVCVCCLTQYEPLIELSSCRHISVLENLLLSKLEDTQTLICQLCHTFIKKIQLFQQQVEESHRTLICQVKQLTTNRKLHTLCHSKIETFSTVNPEPVKFEIKSEAPDHSIDEQCDNIDNITTEIKTEDNSGSENDVNINNITTEIKTEEDNLESKNDVNIDNITTKIIKTEEDNSDSENDVPLSQIANKNKKKDEKEEEVEIEKRSQPQEHYEEEIKYKCSKCNKGYPTRAMMEDHFIYQHLGKTTYKCPICNMPKVSRANVERHMLRTHGEKKEKPLKHACSTCGKAFPEKKRLTRHEAVHSSDRRYVCDICQQTFKQNSDMYSHRKKIHKVCPPKRVVIYKPNKHRYQCPICHKYFSWGKAMEDHVNYQHLGKTAHKCPICDKPMAGSGSVKSHMKRVHGEKMEKPRNHVCQTCGKTFTKKCNLSQHEASHSGDRSFVCDICQKAFRQKASLYRHRKREHKVFSSKRVVEYID